MSTKYTIENIRILFEKEGYILLSEEYINVFSKLRVLCKNQHLCEISLDKWLRGRRCLCESNRKRITIDFIKKRFEDEGYTLLDTSYKSKKKLHFICSNGHEGYIRWDHFNSGHRCASCAGRPHIDIDYIKFKFFEENYILLTEVYINSKQKLDYICPNGHKHSITWYNWITGYRCPECAGTMKKTIEFVRSEVEKENYTLITNNYENKNQKLYLICPNGHDYFVTWDNWNNSGSRCVHCNEWGTSLQEKNLIDFVKSICPNISIHNRDLISPYELDIVIPDKKIAIEYCGLYWHSELAGKDKNYHLNKLNMCNEKGYRLITVFEDELVYNEHIVFSRLRNLLCKESDNYIIYARKCFINEISTKEAKPFCDYNHIQGYGSGAKIKLGIFYNNVLVSVMTFSEPSISKGTKVNDTTIWELHRFCSKINYRIIGGASKLLKYFERNYKWSNIFSYADRRWSVGNVYEQIGFKFSGIIKPNYWYINKQHRLHRFNLRKNYNDPSGFTEWELRKAQGWNRIWDCGNIRYDRFNTLS